MKTKAFSVRLQSLVRISDKAFRATDFNGNSDIIPASQIIDRDWEVRKSEAYWITAWILEKKSIMYSTKKTAIFDTFKKELKRNYDYEISFHKPIYIEPVEQNIIDNLIK